MSKTSLPAGWGHPGAARGFHYFLEGEATPICGRWLYTGPREPEQVRADGTVIQDKNDCRPCRRKLQKRKAQDDVQ